MSPKQLLDAIHKRNSTAVFSNAFKQHDLVTGHGWVNTRSKLEALLSDSSTSAATFAKLQEIYIEHLLYAQKAVILWSIPREAAQMVWDQMDTWVDTASPYLPSYPLPLSDAQLQAPNQLGVPSGFHATSLGKTLVFVSKRVTTVEETVPYDQMPEAYRNTGYTECVIKRNNVQQVFDSVTIDLDIGLVEVRIDQAKHLSEKDVLKYKEAIRARFNQLVLAKTGIADLLGDALNLYDSLTPLYKGSDWTVQRIGHVNEGGYINSNRGRHRVDDVRADLYHKNGETHVTNLQLWSLNAVFKSPLGHGMPQLVLEGQTSILSSLTPTLDIARIYDCAGLEDYELVVNTLLECVNRANASIAALQQPIPVPPRPVALTIPASGILTSPTPPLQ